MTARRFKSKLRNLYTMSGNLTASDLALIESAKWSEEDRAFVVAMVCQRCYKPFWELLAEAIGLSAGAREIVCIGCDPIAEMSSGVSLLSMGDSEN
jgi:hypothetical protein